MLSSSIALASVGYVLYACYSSVVRKVLKRLPTKNDGWDGDKNYALFDDKMRVRGHGAAMEFCSGGIFFVWRNGVLSFLPFLLSHTALSTICVANKGTTSFYHMAI